MRVVIGIDALEEILLEYFGRDEVFVGCTMDIWYPEDANPDAVIMVDLEKNE